MVGSHRMERYKWTHFNNKFFAILYDWPSFLLRFFGRGDLGLGEIKGQSSSTSFRNSALLILKFFFQSSSKHLSSFILRYQRSARQGFIQKRFFFRGLFLNDLWRQRVIAEFSRTDVSPADKLAQHKVRKRIWQIYGWNNCCSSSSGKHVTDDGRHVCDFDSVFM